MEAPKTIEPGWRHAARLWWSFTWRWPLLMLIPLVPAALAAGVWAAFAKPAAEAVQCVAALLSWPIVVWAQIAAFRRLLRVDYKDFSVRAVARRTAGE
jgi:hypothetical protein